jgi:adenylyltransferase/sulfurtransferase
VGRLLLVDALRVRFRELAVTRDPDCAVCGERPTVTRLIDYETYCGMETHPEAGAEVSATELASTLQGKETPLVVDVREPWEWEIARIEGSELMPLGELPSRMKELGFHREIVTVCHKGKRSLEAQQLLRGAGFRARSLAGGIDAWAVEVEPGMARY